MAAEGVSHTPKSTSSSGSGGGSHASTASNTSRPARSEGSTIPGGDTLTRRESRQAARSGDAHAAQAAPAGSARGDSAQAPATHAQNRAGIFDGGPFGPGGLFGGGGPFGGASGNGGASGPWNGGGANAGQDAGASAGQSQGGAQAGQAQGGGALDPTRQSVWETADKGITAKGNSMGSAQDVVDANRNNAYNAIRDGDMSSPGAKSAFDVAKDGLWDLGKAAGQDPGQISAQVDGILNAMTHGPGGGGQPSPQGGQLSAGATPGGQPQGGATQSGQNAGGATAAGQPQSGAAQGGQNPGGATTGGQPQSDAAQGGQAQGGSSGKKGVGIYNNDAGGGGSSGFNGQSAAKLNPNWYYNWDSQPWGNTVPGKNGQPAPEFVPTMKPGAGSAANSALAGGNQHLLGFNEPDNGGMGGTGMSVQGALQQWPAATPNAKIGSPGFANADSKFAQDFMRQADASGKQIDFLNYHHYPDMSGGKTVDQAVQETVDGVNRFHGQFGKNPLNGQDRKVWITEYGLQNGTPGQQQEFAMKINKAFEANPNVERYSPFTNAHGSYGIGQMIDGNGALTKTGKDYAATGSS